MARSSSGGNFGPSLVPGSRAGGGRYLLKRLVGRGDFSELWLARDVKNARDVALKFLPAVFLQDKNLLEHFQQEINRSRLLQHPHIVSTYELALDHDATAIVMEFVDGWSLATMKVDKLTHCYSLEEIEPLVREACEALAYAHNEFGLVHGDLKPSNLLASAREGIKVSDFGFAALARSESSRRGIIKGGSGGIGFLSPQQVMGEPLSKLDDVYSLGATIFDLLTGTPPFYKGEIIAQVCSLKSPAMTERLKELAVQCEPISPVWEETVAACLAKNPADRPQSVEEVLELLERKELLVVASVPESPEEILSTASETTPPPKLGEPDNVTPSEPQSARPASSKRAGMMFFFMVVGLLILAGLAAALLFTHQGKVVASSRVTVSTSGSLDQSFNVGTGADKGIRSLALQPDGKILIGGLFTNFRGVDSRKMARLNPDGTLDLGFSTPVPGSVYAIALQPDGKILIGGFGVLQGGRPNRRLARLETDGSRDTEFHGDAVYNGSVEVIAVLPDGGTAVGGRFTRVAGKLRNGLVRLSSDGKNDDAFNLNLPAATVFSLAAQPDGKILAAGSFKDATGRVSSLARLNPDGSFDSGFNNGWNIYAEISYVLWQTNGQILICGDLNSTNGLLPYVARLNPNGSPDASFRFSSNLNGSLYCLAVQADGKIIIGGRSLANGAPHPFLGRLNADGTTDGTFQTTSAGGDSVWAVAVQPDQKIVVAGQFTNFDGEPCGNIVRLQN
jgi:uncharacterized delta-60 repeat protein